MTLYIQQWGRALHPWKPSRWVRAKLAIARFLLRGTRHELTYVPKPPVTILNYPESKS
jgi:hypothetical protein